MYSFAPLCDSNPSIEKVEVWLELESSVVLSRLLIIRWSRTFLYRRFLFHFVYVRSLLTAFGNRRTTCAEVSKCAHKTGRRIFMGGLEWLVLFQIKVLFIIWILN